MNRTTSRTARDNEIKFGWGGLSYYINTSLKVRGGGAKKLSCLLLVC